VLMMSKKVHDKPL